MMWKKYLLIFGTLIVIVALAFLSLAYHNFGLFMIVLLTIFLLGILIKLLKSNKNILIKIPFYLGLLITSVPFYYFFYIMQKYRNSPAIDEEKTWRLLYVIIYTIPFGVLLLIISFILFIYYKSRRKR